MVRFEPPLPSWVDRANKYPSGNIAKQILEDETVQNENVRMASQTRSCMKSTSRSVCVYMMKLAFLISFFAVPVMKIRILVKSAMFRF